MKSIEAAVREFHDYNGYPVDEDLTLINNDASSNQLLALAEATIELSRGTRVNALTDMKDKRDDRLYRAHLMLEELGETIRALGTQNEEELADGLADLEYVTTGTAITYRIPLGAVTAEVHRSNMTKSQRIESDPRMRNKGSGYRAPDIAGVLERSRR